MPTTFYNILGVLPEAEDIVIKAAYRALAQRYHPDKWTGSPTDAISKMAKINEAYSILSDPIRRKEYDSSINDREYEDESSDDFHFSVDVDGWLTAIEYYPDLLDIFNHLSKISKQLGYSFQFSILETKQFNDRFEISNKMEKRFFIKYFGHNEEIIYFSKYLILRGEKTAVKELNKVINVLGSGSNPEIIINKICKKFHLTDFLSKSISRMRMERSFKVKENLTIEKAIDFIKFLGGTIISEPSLVYRKYEISYFNKIYDVDKSEILILAINLANEYIQKNTFPNKN